MHYQTKYCATRVGLCCVRSSDLKGFFPSFKTLDLAADQIRPRRRSTRELSKIVKIYKGKSTADIFGSCQKLTVAPRAL